MEIGTIKTSDHHAVQLAAESLAKVAYETRDTGLQDKLENLARHGVDRGKALKITIEVVYSS